MISVEEILQIEQYLISKKLPLDILLEVKDHMILQIEEYIINENISFEEAFLKVEHSWEDNFSLTTYWMFYGREKLPKIAKNIMKQKFSAILMKSFVLAFLFFSISFLLVPLSDNLEFYTISFILSNSFSVLIPLVIYFGNLKYKDYFKKNFKYKGQINYTLYQQNLTLFLICFFGINQIIIEGGEQLYNFFESKQSLSIITLTLTSTYRFLIYVFSFFSIFNFLEHKKTIKKLIPFYTH